jgi:two-component system, NtrC family, sensor histidine kinase HydH
MNPRFSRHAAAMHAIGVAAVTAGIGALHYLTPDEPFDVHYVLQRLFYAPVVYAGVKFGWKGGLAAGLFSGLAYLPQIVAFWRIDPRFSVNQYVEVILFCVVGTLTGFLVARERRQKKELQQTADELKQVYAELQANFEHMKRAERLYALGQLSAGLAHEIRNPLSGIEGAASILLREPPSPERRVEFLEIIRKECHRLNRLLTSFLEFAKPAAPAYQTLPLEPLVDSVIALTRNAVGRQPITIRKSIASNLPTLECDPAQMTQLLLNLAINAVQAMPQGGELLISAFARAPKLLITVADQGSGVGMENLDRIFDPFFTTKESGTGLGLAVAHQIVLNHAGTLTASRNPDKGMTFTIQIPIMRSAR